MEGVMMIGQNSVGIAVRRPNDEIDLTTKPLPNLTRGKIRRIPFVRGVIVLAESLTLGIQALFHSANIALEEEGEEEEISGPLMWGVLALAVGLMIGLFFLVPIGLAKVIPFSSEWAQHTAEHTIRMGLFLAYLGAMNLVPSIRRVFAYHGAEHKTVNAYEDGAPMQVEAVRRYSTAHLRCGTSFLLTVFIIAVVLFILIGDLDLWFLVLSRIVLVPVIAGIAYEISRFSAGHAETPFVHALALPGLGLQKLTTRQPDDAQIEVAIRALKKVLEDDGVFAKEDQDADNLSHALERVNENSQHHGNHVDEQEDGDHRAEIDTA
jgi:uncharacterized protein YqhQ